MRNWFADWVWRFFCPHSFRSYNYPLMARDGFVDACAIMRTLKATCLDCGKEWLG